MEENMKNQNNNSEYEEEIIENHENESHDTQDEENMYMYEEESSVSEPEYSDMQTEQEDIGEVQNMEENYEYTQSQNTVEKKTRRRHSFGMKMAAMGLCCALIGGAVGAALVQFSANGSTNSADSSTTVLTGSRNVAVSTSSVDTSEELTAAEVYAQNVNSTVGITTTVTTNYFGYETTSAASGSGFILTADGYILTNYHVIEDSSEITVSMYDGTSYEAELVGYDENNDIAVLKIDAEDLTPVVLGDSDEMNVGDSVVAIGNPLGELTFSLTSGAISALNRSITLSTNVTMNLIQTDCAINSGNSGGALFNMYGEVIGITNAKYSSSSSSEASIDNIGFAIPINSVKDIVTSIIENGTYEKAYIGVSVSDMTINAASASGLTSGAVVQSVTEGSPAEDAGIESGDIITAVDGEEITSASDLSTKVSSTSVGDQLVLTVNRDGETMEITVTVGSQTQSALPDSEDSTETEEGTYEDNGNEDDRQDSFPFGNDSDSFGGGRSDSSSDDSDSWNGGTDGSTGKL